MCVGAWVQFRIEISLQFFSLLFRSIAATPELQFSETVRLLTLKATSDGSMLAGVLNKLLGHSCGIKVHVAVNASNGRGFNPRSFLKYDPSGIF